MKDKFLKVISELNNFNLPAWNEFPNIDLYMDQVVTYLDRELNPLKVNNEDKILTTSMINNYVKGNLIKAPDHKKYNKEHLNRLLIISSLKQILSISSIEQLLNSYTNKDSEDLYSIITKEQKDSLSKELDAFNSFFEKLESSNENIQEEISLYIIRLAINAEVQKILAGKLLNVFEETKQESVQEVEKEKKPKNKKKDETI